MCLYYALSLSFIDEIFNLFQTFRSNLELLIYKTSMSYRCSAALDISTEELLTNSAKLRNFPSLYEYNLGVN